MSESDGNTAMLTVEMGAFLLGFSCPTPAVLLLAPILLGLGEATRSELLGTKRVKTSYTYIYIDVDIYIGNFILQFEQSSLKCAECTLADVAQFELDGFFGVFLNNAGRMFLFYEPS